MKELPEKLTYGEAYDPAMKMTDPKEAEEYLKALVKRGVKYFGQTHEEAERIQKESLGYYAGYYDTETMARVHKLFQCSHPIFGRVKTEGDLPTSEEAFEMGRRLAKSGNK